MILRIKRKTGHGENFAFHVTGVYDSKVLPAISKEIKNFLEPYGFYAEKIKIVQGEVVRGEK